jgi:hypothetical protein
MIKFTKKDVQTWNPCNDLSVIPDDFEGTALDAIKTFKCSTQDMVWGLLHLLDEKILREFLQWNIDEFSKYVPNIIPNATIPIYVTEACIISKDYFISEKEKIISKPTITEKNDSISIAKQLLIDEHKEQFYLDIILNINTIEVLDGQKTFDIVNRMLNEMINPEEMWISRLNWIKEHLGV